jgi:vacuolar protein-sorting-associated protein 4
MVYVDFTKDAIKNAKQASIYDTAGDHKKAYGLYKLSISLFNEAIKYTEYEVNKPTLIKKRNELVERNKVLEKYMKTAKISSTQNENTENDKLRTSLSNSIITDITDIKWEDVVGLEAAKNALEEAILLPIKFPQLFTGKRKPWKGILLYGPPGTGKSYIAKAIANKVKCTFFSISSSDIMSKWQGESEKIVKTLFQMAREKKPSIIFIDEIDSLCGSRSDNDNESSRRVKTEFLVQMDGAGENCDGVLVLAATNIPWIIDLAVRRRFEKRIFITLPDESAREKMFKIHMGDTKCTVTNKDWAALALKTSGYSGSDISILVKNALMEPIRVIRTSNYFKYVSGTNKKDKTKIVDDFITPCSKDDPKAIKMTIADIKCPKKLFPPPVTYKDFIKALKNTKPSVNQGDLVKHKEFTIKYGQEAKD